MLINYSALLELKQVFLLMHLGHQTYNSISDRADEHRFMYLEYCHCFLFHLNQEGG